MRSAALAVLCGLLPALFLTACDKDAVGGGADRSAAARSATATGPVSAVDGRKLAAAVALPAEDWGTGFEKGDPYEDAASDYSVTDASCKEQIGRAPASLVAQLSRYVSAPSPDRQTVDHLGSSGISVFGAQADAKKDFADSRADFARCPSWTNADGTTTDSDDRVVEAPALQLADEVFAVEGRTRYANDGGGLLPFYQLTARKGTNVLTASLDGAQGSSTTELAALVQAAMTTMLVKLDAETA